MRDAVICEPLRTPVGRYGGVFRDVPAADLAATVIRELRGAHRRATRGHRRRAPRPVLPQRRGSGDRTCGRPRCRPADLGHRVPARPALRLGAADHHQRGHAGPDRSERRRPGRRRREHEPGRVLHDRHAMGGRIGERRDVRPAGPGPGHGRAASTTRCPAGCSRRPRTCVGSTQIPRQEQDEFALRSHQRAVAAQEKGRLRRGDRPDHGPRAQGRHGRRAPTSTRARTPRSSRWPSSGR